MRILRICDEGVHGWGRFMVPAAQLVPHKAERVECTTQGTSCTLHHRSKARTRSAALHRDMRKGFVLGSGFLANSFGIPRVLGRANFPD